MRTVFSCLVGLILCVASPTHAAEPVTVLGLPLGGKMTPSPKACRALTGDKFGAQKTCWVYSTVLYKGIRSGMLHVAEPNGRPGWAAYADFEAYVDKNGTLREFVVISQKTRMPQEIIDSISARFGRPTSSSSNPPFKWHATWNRPEIGISVQCTLGDKCYTRFKSADVMAVERAEIQALIKADARRPVTP